MFKPLCALTLLLGVMPATGFSSDYVLVTNAYSSRVTKIDVGTNTAISNMSVADSIGVPVPNITNIALDTVHNWAYIADHTADAISIIDLNSWTTTGPVTPAGMGKQPIGMALNAACDRMYLATYGTDGVEDPTDPVEVYTISGTSFPPTLSKVTSVPAGRHPVNIALSRDEKYVMVTCRNQACFTVVSTASNSVVHTRNYPDPSYEPEGVDLHPTQNLAYVFSHGQNSFDIFDFDSMKVVNTISIAAVPPPQPSGGAFSPAGNRLLISCQTSARELLFDTSDPRHPVSLPNVIMVGPQPHKPLFISDTIAYVPNTNNTQPVGSISIVSVGASPANLGQVTGTFNGPLGMELVKVAQHPAATPPVYVTFVSHNEENPVYMSNKAFYLQNREYIRQLAVIVKSKNAMWNFQSDWTFLKAVALYDSGAVLVNTNGKNIVRWLVEDMGFEADPHAHESQYNYADIAYLHTQIGVTPSKNVGGFLYDPPDNEQGWEQHEAGTFGVMYPSYFWKPDNFWGAATYLHMGNDDFSSGIWKPKDRYNFYVNDDTKHLTYIGAGCGRLATLVDAIANHTLPDTGFYTMTLFIPQADLNAQKIQNYSAMIDSIASYVAQTRAVWSPLTQTANAWRTAHASRAFRVDCNLLLSCCTGSTGNVDGSADGVVDISDVFAVVDYLSASIPLSACPQENDVNQDGTIDISDLFAVIDYLSGAATLPPCP